MSNEEYVAKLSSVEGIGKKSVERLVNLYPTVDQLVEALVIASDEEHLGLIPYAFDNLKTAFLIKNIESEVKTDNETTVKSETDDPLVSDLSNVDPSESEELHEDEQIGSDLSAKLEDEIIDTSNEVVKHYGEPKPNLEIKKEPTHWHNITGRELKVVSAESQYIIHRHIKEPLSGLPKWVRDSRQFIGWCESGWIKLS